MNPAERDRGVKYVERTDEHGRRRALQACDIEDCWEPATQSHGFYPDLIVTCDAHAEQVILELLGGIGLDVPE